MYQKLTVTTWQFRIVSMIIFIFLQNCFDNGIQRGNFLNEKQFGEMIFEFKSQKSKLSELNPRVIFKGSESFDLNHNFSPETYDPYDFIIDRKLKDMNQISLKLKPGFYFGYFELNNMEIKPLLKSRFSIKKIYFGYDPSKYSRVFNNKVEFYEGDKCFEKDITILICPKIKIEEGRDYLVQFDLQEEVVDGKITAMLWFGTPFLPLVAISGTLPPSILLGTVAYTQEIKANWKSSRDEKK